MLQIRLNGKNYRYFKKASVVMDIGAVTRAFSFVSSATEYSRFPLKMGDTVEILADDVFLLKGHIEKLGVTNNATTHDITVSGRSLLGDLVDSSVVGSALEFSKVTLPQLCRAIMQQLGFSGRVENNAGDILPFTDLSSAEVGQGAYDFIETYSRKRQVLLTSDGADTLVLTRAGVEEAPSELSNASKETSRNNIKESSLQLDHTNIFSRYKVHAQLNPGLQGLGIDLGAVVEQYGLATDGEVRSTRQLEMNAEESMSSQEAGDRAKWEANVRRANALTYSAIIVGHTVNGMPWYPNTVVKVTDLYANIKGSLLIRKVTMLYDVQQGGSITTLDMTTKKAFTLEVEQSAREANTETVATDFL